MSSKKPSLALAYDPESAHATEFRRLLHRLRNGNGDNGDDMKSLLVTSSVLSEGKSTTCSFLAMTAAHHKGLKTLLIDSDLRRPNLHNHFQTMREPGLVEVLVGHANAADVIRHTEIENLDIITSGKHCSNPADVFHPQVISKAIDELKFFYDLIIVDSAPLVPVSDPMLLAPLVDAILLVVRAGSTQKEIVERALDILGNSRSKVRGVALNNMTNALPYYYDYSHYGYQYHTQDESNSKKSSRPEPKPHPNQPRHPGNSKKSSRIER